MSSVYDRFWKIFLFIFSFGKGRNILMVVNIRRRMKGVRSAVLKDRTSLCLCGLLECFPKWFSQMVLTLRPTQMELYAR